MTNPSVLVIDDNFAVESTVAYDRLAFLEDYGNAGLDFSFCSGRGSDTQEYTSDAVCRFIDGMSQPPNVILLDLRFGEQELLGLEVLRVLSRRYPILPVVMMTSSPKGDLWAKCIDLGAVDYLVKPMQAEILIQTVHRYADVNLGYWLIGQSDTFLTAVDQVSRAAEGAMSSVLLLGAPGTGKELFARLLHRHGSRRAKPFQVIHVPGIPEPLVEAELFGYAKGAFTGAAKEEVGRVRTAAGGVLFLDEVADLTPAAQASLLRVLETREVTRLGDGRTFKADFQVIAATNVNLTQRVKDNLFRLDLYSRLAGTVVHLPTLAERIEDLGLLTRHLLRRAYIERSLALSFIDLPKGLEDVLRTRFWSGNVRDLWNYVQRVLDLARKTAPTRQHFMSALPTEEKTDTASSSLPTSLTPRHLTLEILPIDTVRASDLFVERLAIKELSLLRSALELTRDPATGLQNRARAAALLKGRAKASTNDFNRWVSRVAGRLTSGTGRLLRMTYPELFAETLDPGKDRE